MLMRTDPFRDIDRLAAHLLGSTTRQTSMPIDAYRLGDEFVVQLDLPGVDHDSIDITVERNVLTITARRETAPADGVETLVSERPTGTFSRQLLLGDTLDTDRIRADYTAGVLTVTLQVAAEAKPRRVEVTTNGSARRLDAIDA